MSDLSKRPRLIRPLQDVFWDDVKGALGGLAGVTIGVLVFDDDFDAVAVTAIVLTVVVLARVVRRRVRRRAT